MNCCHRARRNRMRRKREAETFSLHCSIDENARHAGRHAGQRTRVTKASYRDREQDADLRYTWAWHRGRVRMADAGLADDHFAQDERGPRQTVRAVTADGEAAERRKREKAASQGTQQTANGRRRIDNGRPASANETGDFRQLMPANLDCPLLAIDHVVQRSLSTCEQDIDCRIARPVSPITSWPRSPSILKHVPQHGCFICVACSTGPDAINLPLQRGVWVDAAGKRAEQSLRYC